MRVNCRQENPFQRKSWQVKASSLVANKALKAVASPLDVSIGACFAFYAPLVAALALR